MVLELTKLEYPLFFIHVAPDHYHMEFKKLIGTRAHEARVLFSHVSPQATLKLICYPNYQKRKEFDSTHLVSLSPSPLAEHVQTLTPSHHRRQRTLVCTQSQCEVTEASVRALHSDPFTPIHGTLFLSLSPSLKSQVYSLHNVVKLSVVKSQVY